MAKGTTKQDPTHIAQLWSCVLIRRPILKLTGTNIRTNTSTNTNTSANPSVANTDANTSTTTNTTTSASTSASTSTGANKGTNATANTYTNTNTKNCTTTTSITIIRRPKGPRRCEILTPLSSLKSRALALDFDIR